ncbi:unnamed protein product [Phytomonas sp. EM1]|nr:unnamed protein product [Phytomonas sp. EM1]|eukprot:CCW65882.1 unnamed protein product [Phytomonas sp. isolate EM1]
MTQQQACTYAALILQEVNKCDAKSIRAVTAAAGVEVSQGMAAAFEKALSAVNIADVLENVSFAGGAYTGAATVRDATSAAAPAAEKEKAKEEKPVEEEDDDMGFTLFD